MTVSVCFNYWWGWFESSKASSSFNKSSTRCWRLWFWPWWPSGIYGVIPLFLSYIYFLYSPIGQQIWGGVVGMGLTHSFHLNSLFWSSCTNSRIGSWERSVPSTAHSIHIIPYLCVNIFTMSPGYQKLSYGLTDNYVGVLLLHESKREEYIYQ